MGPGQKFLTCVWLGQFFVALGWVSHLWLGFGFGKFPLKIANFSIFFLQIKKLFGSGQKGVNLLFKYARVKSDPISSL